MTEDNRKDNAAKRLAARQQHYDDSKTMDRQHGYTRPGSYKK